MFVSFLELDNKLKHKNWVLYFPGVLSIHPSLIELGQLPYNTPLFH